METLEFGIGPEGVSAFLDMEDVSRLGGCKLYLDGKGYVSVLRGRKRAERLHRIIMRAPTGSLVDHRNGVRTDNRKGNLRFATPTENMRNRRGANRTSTSGAQGVFPTASGTWMVQVGVSGKRYGLGTFASLEEAAIVAATARVGWTA
jgi:hypothetical protein